MTVTILSLMVKKSVALKMKLRILKIFKYIENNDDGQFTLKELKNVCKNATIDNRTIKVRFKVKYGIKIIIIKKSGTLTFNMLYRQSF